MMTPKSNPGYWLEKMSHRKTGCPHEEGIDYPEGEPCPQCPFWTHRDRWTGKLLS
jgi:hypothetical protein